MRLPRPAAGTTPHISGLLSGKPACVAACRLLQQLNQLFRAPFRTVLIKRSLSRTTSHATQLSIPQLERGKRVTFIAGQQDLLTGFEESVDAVPDIAQKRRTAGGGLKQTARGAPAHVCHRPTRHI